VARLVKRVKINRMKNQDAILERASELAFQQLAAADGDVAKLAEPHRTVAIVYSAQGVIDNGGLIYFFESDWPGNPPYALFADAYRRIGCAAAADAIEQAANSFGVLHPEQEPALRNAYMERFSEPAGHDYIWDDPICGDERVWTNLAKWIQKQTSA
jgi:hypothetical protein